MSAPTIAEMLKYANLQMAAEALYDFRAKLDPNRSPGSLIDFGTGHYSGAIDPTWLTVGNEHASRFAPTEATKFASEWTVVDHISNTTTGFSGTLFKNNATNELVMSIRSTEFIDDVARDCVATNSMEVKAFGWAFGQISDMEAWYAKLKADGKLPASAKLDVTGYSLGGHLATAFNLLHQSELNGGQVVTFNGAGVGQLQSGATLQGVINEFNTLRTTPSAIAALFTDTRLRDVYLALSNRIKDGEPVMPSDYTLLNSVAPNQLDSEYQQQQFANEKTWIRSALDRIKTIQTQVARISLGQVTDSEFGAPAKIPDQNIEQENFDYQMAVLKVQEKTVSKSVVTGAYNALFDNKSPGNPQLGNQYDIVGRETTTSVTAMVSNSQWHHGTNVNLFIEDQPLLRGSYTLFDAQTYWDAGSLVPINQYSQNDFGDTHSLVLIVDTLNVQNTLKSLDTSVEPGTLNALLQAASARQAKWETGTQGKAEGDVLEWVVDALAFALTGNDPELRNENAANGQSLNTGGTWADKTLREKFYTQLDLIQKAITDNQLAGKLKVTVANADLATAARTDFAAFLSLYGGFPLGLKSATGQEDAVSAILGGKQGGDLYGNWSADKDLTPAERAAGKAYFSDQYLTDRAAYLASLAAANTGNTGEDKALWLTTPSGEPIYYKDIASGISIETEKGNRAGRQYLFGGKDDETLEGNAGSDKGLSRSFSEMLRSTVKNGQKPRAASPWPSAQAANDADRRQAA